MSLQEEAFLSDEGNAYYRRCIDKPNHSNQKKLFALLSDVVDRFPSGWMKRGARILEIGCNSGENLDFLNRKYGFECYGLEPSREAVEDGNRRFPELKLSVGTAPKLPYANEAFDCVYFGSCLCWCDRTTLFSIAAEADRVLRTNGILLISDFSPPFPYRNTYHHRPGLYTYKMRYRDMFTWNPAYVVSEIRQFSLGDSVFHPDPNERFELVALHKSDPIAPYLTDPFASGDKAKI